MQVIKCYLSNMEMIDQTSLDQIRQKNVLKISQIPTNQIPKCPFKLRDNLIPPYPFKEFDQYSELQSQEIIPKSDKGKLLEITKDLEISLNKYPLSSTN